MSLIKFIIVERHSSLKEQIKKISSNSNDGEKTLILQPKPQRNIEDAIADLQSSKLLDLVSSAYGNFDDVELYKDNENECLINRPIDKEVSILMRKLANSPTTGRMDNQVRAISNLNFFFEEQKDRKIAKSMQSFKDFYIKINELEKNIFLNGEIGDGEFFKKYEREDGNPSPRGEEELKSMDEFKQIYKRYDDFLIQNPDSINRPLNNFLKTASQPYKLMKYQGEINDAENDPKNELNCFLWFSAFSLIFSEISSEGRLNEGCNMLAFIAIYRSYEFLLNATYTALKTAVLKDPALKTAALKTAALKTAALKTAALENDAELENAELENAELKNAALENAALEDPALKDPALKTVALENDAALKTAALENAALKTAASKIAALENAMIAALEVKNAALEVKDAALEVKDAALEEAKKQKKTPFDFKMYFIEIFLKPYDLKSPIFKKMFGDKEEKPLTFKFLKKNRDNFFLVHGTRYVDRKTVQEYIQQCKELVCSLEKDALFDLDNPERRPFNSKYDMLKKAHFYNLSDLLVKEILHSFSLKIQFTNFE